MEHIHLCNSCIYRNFAECPALHVEFGNGKGNDNVVCCDCYKCNQQGKTE